MIKIAKRSYVAALISTFGLAWISPQALARVEETDPSVSYTVGWTQGDTSGTWSGGAAAGSTPPGAQAALPFTGASVSWVGGPPPQTGNPPPFLPGGFGAQGGNDLKTRGDRGTAFRGNG